MSSYNFKVDLKGIIRLLSDNLYSSDKVFLRELLQNAVDAVDARKKEDPAYMQRAEGEITVIYRQRKDGAELIFADNGVGLTKDEIHSFLSVIGQSSKRGSDTVRSSFIGQFGIGLLSCFLVSNEIKVLTRSVKEEKPWQWIGKSDGSYTITSPKKQMEPGTQVHLMLTGEKYNFFTEQEIIKALSEYGFMLRMPISFDGEMGKKALNGDFIPWRRQFSMADEIMSFGEKLFGESFLDMIPLNGDGIKGYAYISIRHMSTSITVGHKIYLKNMYVTEDGRDLIPKWAFFTRCIVNFDDLTPTASREGFIRNSKLLSARNQIEKSMFDYFLSLSEYDVRKLKHIVLYHNVAIKSLVIENDQIFKLFFPFLTFPTNQGTLTGFQIVNASKRVPVSYCVDLDDFRRLSPLIEGTKSLLVNGGYIYDAGILQKLPQLYKNVKITLFDEHAYENLLSDPPEDFTLQMESFRCLAMQGLERFQCGLSFKSFSPKSLQALFIPGADVVFDDTLKEGSFSGFFENFDFGEQDEESDGKRLYLNCDNYFVQSLRRIRDAKLACTMIQVIYIQALLAGHYELGGQELELMNKSLQQLMEYALLTDDGEDESNGI